MPIRSLTRFFYKGMAARLRPPGLPQKRNWPVHRAWRAKDLPEIGSWALPDNRASQRVMEKVGFQYERDFDFAGLEHRFYRLAAGQWEGYDGGV